MHLSPAIADIEPGFTAIQKSVLPYQGERADLYV